MEQVAQRRVQDFYRLLGQLQDTRQPRILNFYHRQHERLLATPGSRARHHAWPGGYIDHVTECLRIASASYGGLDGLRKVPFVLGSVHVVLLFHDIDKLFQGPDDRGPRFDKSTFLSRTLETEYGIVFTDTEHNALQYARGEVQDDPHVRRMTPLAAFVHSCNILSSRMWPDEGRPPPDRSAAA